MNELQIVGHLFFKILHVFPKAIETGMIIDHGHKKILLCIFSKTYKLWCIEGVLYWCKYHFLTFLDKWCYATVGKAGWIFNGFLSRGDF